ncbi:MAG: 6-bladed beta-propeller [Thermodesulfobacteriota bacterium]
MLLIPLCIACAAAGCGTTKAVGRPVPEMVWPASPETPRIRYRGSVARPADLGMTRSFLQKAWDALAGGEKVSLGSPYGVLADPQGRLLVADTKTGRVHVFDTAENRYFFFPGKEKPLPSPIGLAEDGERLFVSDSLAGVVKVYDRTGTHFLKDLGKDLLQRPTGLAISRQKNELLVLDTLQSAIFRFSLADLSPAGKLGQDGAAPGSLHFPTNLWVTPRGDIIVSDSLNFRIQVFSSEGRFLRTFGGAGDSPGSFARPRGVAADSDGNIYVVDALFDNVQIFDSQGRLLLAFGSHGDGPGEFWLPNGIFIDPTDRIFVSDSFNHRVQVFQYLKSP